LGEGREEREGQGERETGGVWCGLRAPSRGRGDFYGLAAHGDGPRALAVGAMGDAAGGPGGGLPAAWTGWDAAAGSLLFLGGFLSREEFPACLFAYANSDRGVPVWGLVMAAATRPALDFDGVLGWASGRPPTMEVVVSRVFIRTVRSILYGPSSTYRVSSVLGLWQVRFFSIK
jgi:hypothetical protein